MSGSAQSTFERSCRALNRADLITNPRFADNRKRLQHVEELDAALSEAFAQFDLPEILRRFDEHQAAIAPVYSVDQIFVDPHYQARSNIATVADEELQGPVRMQNVVGILSRTPGEIKHAGPQLGRHNREILIDELGFSEAELQKAGLALSGQ
jgi:crotonobetainyl-CoA:carnitine CoA-transferase CaiB-like acyl-CoA transferase